MRSTIRLDVQGLRALAVGLVVLNHAFEWPFGGFVGVDIFFVISGFLMTSVLHREFERTGRIRFLAFYRRRVRRLIPASVAVLAATVIGAWAIFGSGRFMSTVWDAIASLFFVSNWRYAAEATDYFAQGAQTSPLQHYWSLSLEEQYYLVWPFAILAIALMVGRTRQPRLFAALSTLAITVALFLLSLQLTQSNIATAYFITPARLWELSVGATVALCMPWFSRLPLALRPFVALLALAGMIAASVVTPTEQGFPAPWAALAVLSAAAFIAFPWQPKRAWLNPLDNPFLSYIGDISYSLYLWHFPALILVTELARGTPSYGSPIPALESIALSLVLAALSYRFIEEPVRHSSWLEPAKRRRRRTRSTVKRLQSIAVAVLSATAIVAVVVALMVDRGSRNDTPPAATPTTSSSSQPTKAPQKGGAALAVVKSELTEALKAEEWPETTPALAAPEAAERSAEFDACSTPTHPGVDECTWGPAGAPVTIAVVGDATSVGYLPLLRTLVDSSNGAIRITALGMYDCPFIDDSFAAENEAAQSACPTRRAMAIHEIGAMKPSFVFVSNLSSEIRKVDGGSPMVAEYKAGLDTSLSKIAPYTGKVVLFAPPPEEKDIRECYAPQNPPSTCVTHVQERWKELSAADKEVATAVGGVWVDTRSLYCVSDNCPAFAAGVPIKFDTFHITEAWSRHIAPAAAELLANAGVDLTGEPATQ
ncbi:acyltransferase family protein [Leifsonia sp. TF02-11]|uniref:acyltransferase family protein n=1 Tax=Leifsonia sp. TF02-11 TaxID=2815212 RepID=UPI001AA1A0BB|nr:acyltransferase family protein [Leifsonia sp. TF02-11]MBO1738381.1 acyltransferase [Leifsonia sp. TF02-11]